MSAPNITDSSSTSTLLTESLIDRQGGILCNDSSGLCLDSQGSLVEEKTTSGTYTNLVKLAQQLQHPAESNDTSPLITIECDDMALLVKEYDGYTVTLRVPNNAADVQSETE